MYLETDPLGEVNSSHLAAVLDVEDRAGGRRPHVRAPLDLPVTIARMNASYGPNGGLPTCHLDAAVAGNAITTRWDPCPYSPIHEDDINAPDRGPARRRDRAGDDRELGRRRGA